MVDSAPADVVCRVIEERDLAKVVDCLMRSFPERPRAFWTDGLARLAARPAVGDLPRFGHLLAAGDKVVGVLLQIVSTRETAEAGALRPLQHGGLVRRPGLPRLRLTRSTPGRSVGAKSSISPSPRRRSR